MSRPLIPAAEFTPEPQDFMALNALALQRSRMGPWVPVLCAALFGLAFTLAAAWTSWPGGARWPVAAAAGLGLGSGWLLCRVLAGPLASPGARLSAGIMVRLARREGLLVPQRVELTAEGLRITSEKGETLTRWSGVREVVRTDEHVFLFISSRIVFLAPRRAFPSRSDFEAFAQEAARLQSAAVESLPGSLGKSTARSQA